MEAPENCSVKVSVHIRPLIGDERLQGCKECVAVVHGKPQVVFISITLFLTGAAIAVCCFEFVGLVN